MLASPWQPAEGSVGKDTHPVPLYTSPPVHSTTEFYSSALQVILSSFYFVPSPLFPLRDDSCGKPELGSRRTPSGRLVFLSVCLLRRRETCQANTGSPGAGGDTSLKISRGGGGTRCLFFCPQKQTIQSKKTITKKKKHKPPPQHLSKPTSQSGLKKHTDSHTH